MQDTAAYLGAAIAFTHAVPPGLQARLLKTLEQTRLPRMQNLSSALLSLARLQQLHTSLWRQHCFILESALPEATGKVVC